MSGLRRGCMTAALRSHSIGFADGTFGYSAQMGFAEQAPNTDAASRCLCNKRGSLSVGSTDHHLLQLSFAPRHLRAGQAAAAAPAAGAATFLLPRYASPVAIMAHTMRAILLARATAATLRGLRSSNASSQAEAVLLPGLA